jgi:acyl-[acyl-carrier-protein]-phospholipid O-acyltransferase / long-chain-fatty-acid--[acyl-carrier-protein] ligase
MRAEPAPGFAARAAQDAVFGIRQVAGRRSRYAARHLRGVARGPARPGAYAGAAAGEDTLHILDAHSAKAWWLEPWRELARTISFNPAHLFISRRLVRVLRGNGRIAVYIPSPVEPDAMAFRLYRAVARVALRAEASVVPVRISASRHGFLPAPGSSVGKRRWLANLRVTALAPKTIPELQQAAGVVTLRPSLALLDRCAEARLASTPAGQTLHTALSAAATRFGAGSIAVQDFQNVSMTYRRLMIAARVIALRLAARSAPGEAIGLLLPNAAATAAAFLAVQSAGSVAAMLNYTAGPGTIASAVRTGSIRLIVSSRAFVDRASLGEEVEAIEATGARILWLEDVRAEASGFAKLSAALLWRRPVTMSQADEAAVMLFTSGSEGAPKAVILTHRNLVANAAQVEARIAFTPADMLFNVLPVFHAFGLTGGLILPLVGGVRLYLYPSPLHYRGVPETVAKVRPTIMLGTDTFLSAYARTAEDGDFASLRMAVAGAEAVRAETQRVWAERFGVTVLEGYGMTEAAPVAALNTSSHGRIGSVGRLLPAMRMRLEPVEGIADGGRLFVSGPNVMAGYLLPDRPNEIVRPRDGWHDSGDIVRVDREGYIQIVGRARRFAKIAGEMISLGAVEMLAQSLWEDAKHAAFAMPDDRKGERIVLLTTARDVDRPALRRQAKALGQSELTVPSLVVHADEIPVLGTGKIDYMAARRLADEAVASSSAA